MEKFKTIELTKIESERIVIYNKVAKIEEAIDVDGVFIAIGVQPATDIVKDLGIERDSKGYIKVDRFQRTNVEGVFAAGDCRRGQSLVVWAINEGRGAAKAIDQYLSKK